MKRNILLFVIAFIAVIGLYFVFKAPESSTNPQQPILGVTTHRQSIAEPVTLSIPSLGVQTSVESVGLDSQQRMDVPKNYEDVGWYNLGYMPGSKGSAVMAGHLDTVTGAPAVFYNLEKLNIGDEVKVTNADGKELTFKVTDKQTYLYDQLPLEKVFNSTDKPRLNLITCQGTFNQSAHNYSHRVVVYTELTSS